MATFKNSKELQPIDFPEGNDTNKILAMSKKFLMTERWSTWIMKRIVNIGLLITAPTQENDNMDLAGILRANSWLWESIIWSLPQSSLTNHEGTIWFISNGLFAKGLVPWLQFLALTPK